MGSVELTPGLEALFRKEEEQNLSEIIAENLQKHYKLRFPVGEAYKYATNYEGQVRRCIIIPEYIVNGLRLFINGSVSPKPQRKPCLDYKNHSYYMHVKPQTPEYGETKKPDHYLVSIIQMRRAELGRSPKFLLYHPQLMGGLSVECECRIHQHGRHTRGGLYRICKHFFGSLCYFVTMPLGAKQHFMYYEGKAEEVLGNLDEILTFILVAISKIQPELISGLSADPVDMALAVAERQWKKLRLKTFDKLMIEHTLPPIESKAIDRDNAVRIVHTLLRASKEEMQKGETLSKEQFESRSKERLKLFNDFTEQLIRMIEVKFARTLTKRDAREISLLIGQWMDYFSSTGLYFESFYGSTNEMPENVKALFDLLKKTHAILKRVRAHIAGITKDMPDNPVAKKEIDPGFLRLMAGSMVKSYKVIIFYFILYAFYRRFDLEAKLRRNLAHLKRSIIRWTPTQKADFIKNIHRYLPELFG